MASGFARGYRFVHHVKRGKRPINDGKLVSLITANTFENFARPYRVKIAGVLCTIVAVAPQNDLCDMFK